jgi:hypothetical protein
VQLAIRHAGTVQNALGILIANSPVSFEVLDGPLVLFGRGPGTKRAEIPALAGFGVWLARVQPILTGFQFADHGGVTKSTQ